MFWYLSMTSLITRWVPLVEQELPTLTEHLSYFFLLFCRSLFVLCTFSFGHCVVCPLIYGFWLPLWYLQTFLIENSTRGSRPTCLLNLNILGEHTKEFVLNKRLRKPTGQSRIDNSEKMSIISAQDTGRRQTKQSEIKKQNIAQKIKKVTPRTSAKTRRSTQVLVIIYPPYFYYTM